VEKELPDFLYHYTSIESLALILKNRTILFNNLKDLDDLEEGFAPDHENIGKYFFVSCWTYSDEDNISMWHMYSEKMHGVRLRMPVNQFDDKPRIHDEFNEYYKYSPHDVIDTEKFFMMLFSNYTEPATRTFYTDNEDKLRTNFFVQDEKGDIIHTSGKGVYKRKCWEFQKEVRYHIMVRPKETYQDFLTKSAKENWKDSYYREDAVNFRKLFLKIKDDAFEQMEVMLGPGVSPGQKIIIQSLIDKYNPKATITESQLTGKIRV